MRSEHYIKLLEKKKIVFARINIVKNLTSSSKYQFTYSMMYMGSCVNCWQCRESNTCRIYSTVNEFLFYNIKLFVFAMNENPIFTKYNCIEIAFEFIDSCL